MEYQKKRNTPDLIVQGLQIWSIFRKGLSENTPVSSRFGNRTKEKFPDLEHQEKINTPDLTVQGLQIWSIFRKGLSKNTPNPEKWKFPDLEYRAIEESRGFCRKGKGSMGRKKKKTDTTEKLSCNLIVRITENEREQLKTHAVERGFQDTAKYCRMILRNYEVMNWSDLNRELQKLKYEINNMESMLNQIDKNVSYSTYPKETEQRFHDCVNQMKEMSQKLERLLETKERNGA